MLKVVRHHHNNIEEVYPINGIYKVYELDTYELEYSSDSPIVEQNVFLEDILLDYSLFNISQSRIETIKPEYLFIDYFGFASLRINNEIFNFNILIEKLKKNDAEDMLMYLWEKDKYLYNIFLSKSSVTASNVQETDINLTSKFINHMNYFHDKMLEYSVYFKSLPYYVLRPKSELSKYSVNLVDADSIPWILENLNVVSFSPELRYDPDAINFNGAYGIINQLLINKPDHCYSTYENNIILGSFLRLINKLSSLKKEICNNIDVTERYSDEHYLDFRDLKKVPYVRLLKDAIEIKRKLENLYLRYKNIFIDATPKIERPILTPVFIGRRHYANAFRLIQKTWNAKFDFQGDILLFNIQKMSHLYEMYNFYLLIECIDKEMINLGFEINNNANINNAKNLRSYNRNKFNVNFYYEPSYYDKKLVEVDLIRINNDKGIYYKPDFLLEFVFPNKNKIYCVLDAKYSQQGTVRKRLNDCIYKYILNTGIYQSPYRKIDYLFTLAPIDKKFDYIMNDSYYPQIGIIPAKPSNTIDIQNTISRLIKEYCNIMIE
jgi:hypothetical protein